MNTSPTRFIFFALAAYGKGISGGDRIFIELAKRWSKKFPVTIYLWQEGLEMCARNGLDEGRGVSFCVSDLMLWSRLGFAVNYIARIIEGVRLGVVTQVANNPTTVIYSASEFWMDTLPAFLLKLRFPKTVWMAAWYQTAPSPLVGFTQGDRQSSYKLSAFMYWLAQLPIKPVISKFADFVLVNNTDEKKQFTRLNRAGRAVVVLGAVDLKKINEWKLKTGSLPKVYDAVFQGRFHPQKGVVELIDIWRKVVDGKPGAKLVMIGDGPLMSQVRERITRLKLQENISVLGFVFDGDRKYRVFAQSEVVLHPAFYDSGGMAAAEAMAFGLPAVGFDLPAYTSYYPQGMVKIEIGDLAAFARATLKLLTNQGARKRLGREAQLMVQSSWSWDTRAAEILNYVKS